MIQDETGDRTLNELDVKLPFRMGIADKWKIHKKGKCGAQ